MNENYAVTLVVFTNLTRNCLELFRNRSLVFPSVCGGGLIIQIDIMYMKKVYQHAR